jgi:hypothetical protein
MYHVLGRQAVASGDLGFAGSAAAKRAAFGEQLQASRAMDRAINAATAQERSIGRIDDGVNAECGDVGNDDLKPDVAGLACRQFRPPR